MQSFGSEEFINARSTTVWEVLTDAGNFIVWESGITEIDGEPRNGGTIRIKTKGRKRALRLRVQQLPGQVMIWSCGLPFGLSRSMARWLSLRRREAAGGTLDPACSAGLARVPGWLENRREAADEARWHQRRAELVAFREEGHDWPRHKDCDSEREHTLGVWIQRSPSTKNVRPTPKPSTRHTPTSPRSGRAPDTTERPGYDLSATFPRFAAITTATR